MNERGTYSQCGWNQSYVFGETEFDLATSQMSCMVKRGQEQEDEAFPMSTMHYLLSHCTYGGCMEDEMDMATLERYLKIVCPTEVLEDKTLDLDPDGVYRTDQLEDHETLMRYLGGLPKSASHKLARMSEANHRRKDELKGEMLVKKLISAQDLLPHLLASDEQEEESWDYAEEERRVKVKLTEILETLPELFELLEEDTQEILKLVLDQELQKYNCLLETMEETLESALHGIEGFILATKEIDDLIDDVKEGEIPACWQEVAYPTMEDLDGFLEDLRLRTQFLRDWQKNGPPETFWLAALFEPGDFLIAVLYIHR